MNPYMNSQLIWKLVTQRARCTDYLALLMQWFCSIPPTPQTKGSLWVAGQSWFACKMNRRIPREVVFHSWKRSLGFNANLEGVQYLPPRHMDVHGQPKTWLVHKLDPRPKGQQLTNQFVNPRQRKEHSKSAGVFELASLGDWLDPNRKWRRAPPRPRLVLVME